MDQALPAEQINGYFDIQSKVIQGQHHPCRGIDADAGSDGDTAQVKPGERYL